jgi:hypothetical protein
MEDFPRLLDKTKFDKKMKILAISVPVSQTSLFVGKLKDYLWKHSKSILSCPNDDSKKVIFLDAKYDDVGMIT